MTHKDIHKKNDASLVIKQLLHECNLKEADLARQTGLPQTTINRLLLGGTSDPRANTLKPIADFFGVTIGQLCGFEPLTTARIRGLTQPNTRSAWQFIPIIEWSDVSAWVFTQKKITPVQHKHWISTEREVSEQAFALKSLSFMEPRFRKNSLLIIDPEISYRDGHFIIIALDSVTPTVRKVLMDGANTMLQAFDQSQASLKLTSKHRIYGTIVESRVDTYHV